MKILYVEDSTRLARVTADSLMLNGHIVEHVDNYDEAKHCLLVDSYDVVLLDRMLPNGKDGLELCKEIKASGDITPVIMLTALSGPDHRILGLENGADEYIEKPFKLKELLLRINLVTRHSNDSPAVNNLPNGVTVNIPRKTLEVNDLAVRLSKKEWSLLEYLLLHPNQILSKDLIIDRVWGQDSDVLPNSVEAKVRQLRVKLRDTEGETIQTIHGFGYKMSI
jgi:two-component system OmpR family response regulator